MGTTNRTATTAWKRIRDHTKRQARASGLTQCPTCHNTLNWDTGKQPNSAEVDHIVPHSRGGTDTPDNLRILCRRCNQSRGNRTAPKLATVMKARPLKTSRRW